MFEPTELTNRSAIAPQNTSQTSHLLNHLSPADRAMLMQLLVESAPMRVDPDQQWTDEQLVEEFLREKGENSVHTREAYDRDLNQFRAFLSLEYGEKSLADADAIAVDAYVVQLKQLAELGELSAATVNRRIAALSSLYNWAAKPKRRAVTGIFTNPVDVKRLKVNPQFSDRVLTEAQALKLIQAAATSTRSRCQARDAALIQFLLHTGCRVSEAVNLFWQHIQAQEEGAIVHIRGKGNKDRWIRIGAKMWQKLAMLSDEKPPKQPVFVTERGGAMNRDTVSRVVMRTGKLIGVEKLTPHMLRHTHATHAIRRGVPIDLVQQTLGHSSLNTTAHYLAANPTESSGLYLAY